MAYGPLNGYSLYLNGRLFGATGNVTYQSGGALTTLFIGYYSTCSWASGFVNSVLQGSIYEVYVFNRELTQTDVSGLANPRTTEN